MRSYDLNGRTALITGASSGIGRALAEALARAGCQVGLIARRQVALTDVATHIEQFGGRALPLPADVLAPELLKDVVVTAMQAWGRIDIAVANAGVGRLHRVANLTTEKISDIMNLNFYGAWNLFNAVLPGMLAAENGHLVGISSVASFRGAPKSAPYSASKAALDKFMESMRVELKPKGIYCTVIHPGFVNTPLAAQNNFKMPFILEADDAARRIIRIIAKRKSEAVIPWQLAAFAPFYRLLPNRLFDKLTAGL